MIVVTTTQTRQNIGVDFYIDTQPVVKSTFTALLNSTAHMAAAPTFSLSVDGLVHTSIATYNDQTQLDAFLAEMDAVLPSFFDSRDTYCAANAITVNRVVSTVL